VFYAVLGAVVAGVLIYHSPRLKRRREALIAFNKLRRSFLSGGDVSVLASGLSVLMRRVALYRFGREKMAGLNGEAWINFLAKTGADLNEQDKHLLAMQAYAPPSADQDFSGGKHLLRSVQKWLEHNL
jgi:hypothetical protein